MYIFLQNQKKQTLKNTLINKMILAENNVFSAKKAK